MVVAAEGARVGVALTVLFRVATSSLGASIEGMGRRSGTVVNSITVAVHSALHVRCYAPLAPSSVVIVSVVKRVGPRVVLIVVINDVVVVPIRSPVGPAPPISTVEADSEPDSKREVRAAK